MLFSLFSSFCEKISVVRGTGCVCSSGAHNWGRWLGVSTAHGWASLRSSLAAALAIDGGGVGFGVGISGGDVEIILVYIYELCWAKHVEDVALG